jgi:hypothetical protein
VRARRGTGIDVLPVLFEGGTVVVPRPPNRTPRTAARARAERRERIDAEGYAWIVDRVAEASEVARRVVDGPEADA